MDEFYGIVEVNRHITKLFEEPLGQRGLPELLTAFSSEEIEKMKTVPGEDMNYGASIWMEEMIENFAQAKDIDQQSFYHLANCINYYEIPTLKEAINFLDDDNRLYSDLQNLDYYEIPTLKEAINFLDNSFENEETSLKQKFCNFRELNRLIQRMRDLLEDRMNGLDVDASPFWGTNDYEQLTADLEYRYALHFLETLLILN